MYSVSRTGCLCSSRGGDVIRAVKDRSFVCWGNGSHAGPGRMSYLCAWETSQRSGNELPVAGSRYSKRESSAC